MSLAKVVEAILIAAIIAIFIFLFIANNIEKNAAKKDAEIRVKKMSIVCQRDYNK